MEKVTFINSKGNSIVIEDELPFVLTEIQGMETPKSIIQSQKSPNQDGKTYLGNTLDTRVIPIELEIVTKDLDEMLRRRKELMQIFNPKLGEGRLIYERGNIKRAVKAIAEIPPYFPPDKQFDDTMQPCLIQLVCHNAFLEDTQQNKEEIALWISKFEFPLELLEEGIEMGHRESHLTANIYNKGDVPCGMKIEFKALATVSGLSLFNVNTREYFKINKDMEKGEIITITTHYQDKKVVSNLNGVITTVTDWDILSTFLQLDVGDNIFRYDADAGVDNLEVSIYYTPQYLGV